MNLLALEVHEQALRGEQHRPGGVYLVEPAGLKRRPGVAVLPRPVGQQLAAQGQRLGKLDCQPPHGAVDHAPELGLQAFPYRNHRASWMLGEEPAYCGVEGRHPHRVPPDAAARIGEIVVELIHDLDGARVPKQ